jgi:hypothetical protein
MLTSLTHCAYQAGVSCSIAAACLDFGAEGHSGSAACRIG